MTTKQRQTTETAEEKALREAAEREAIVQQGGDPDATEDKHPRTAKDPSGRTIVRVFHPELDSYHDVPADDEGEWLEAGWKKSPGENNHVAAYPHIQLSV